ncbi:hypothetical protein [Plantactinospora sp. GCM10030261]|uniref:hypothetical protein n=1 Tax=Plantactinospora sp. GCM10030261 TaxID=3273420 RepID=UPI003616C412
MDVTLALVLGLTALWSGAGFLADGMPHRASARSLRRRGTLLLTLYGVGLLGTAVLFGLVTTTGAGTLVLALPVVPATVVAAWTVPRLRRLRAGAGALARVPDAPLPPALRAAAAHPLVMLPPQVAGLSMLPAAALAVGSAGIDAGTLLGPAVTGAVLVMVAVAVRHALRHNRLVERATAALPGFAPPRRPGPVGPAAGSPVVPADPVPALAGGAVTSAVRSVRTPPPVSI